MSIPFRQHAVIGRYLMSTLVTFPLAALYLFVILPRVDGAGMLILTLAPAFVWMGYIQADPARTARALPMFSCFIVAMGFLDRFQADFALFLNTGLAQVGGIVTTLVVTKLFRSASTQFSQLLRPPRETGMMWSMLPSCGRSLRHRPLMPRVTALARPVDR